MVRDDDDDDDDDDATAILDDDSRRFPTVTRAMGAEETRLDVEERESLERSGGAIQRDCGRRARRERVVDARR